MDPGAAHALGLGKATALLPLHLPERVPAVHHRLLREVELLRRRGNGPLERGAGAPRIGRQVVWAAQRAGIETDVFAQKTYGGRDARERFQRVFADGPVAMAMAQPKIADPRNTPPPSPLPLASLSAS